MPAVVRVKRRIDEEPLGAFVLNGKKRRIDENSTIDSKESNNLFETKDEISTILKFAGTVRSQDEKATTQIARLSKDEAKELAKRHRQPINATERARQEMRAHGHENRFKVVNCFRTMDTDAEESAPKEITIVDIEKQPHTTMDTTTTVEASTSSNSSRNNDAAQAANFTPTDSDGYVYDLYLPENEQQADNVDYTDNYLSIRAFDDLVYEDRYNNDDEDNESNDSNEENHFGNDYPDEEDDNDSIGERDMRRAVEGINIDSDEYEDEDEEKDLSSEDEYEPYDNVFVHTINAEDESFEDDIDFRDVDRYGTAYAIYKAKILRSMQDDGNYHSSSSEKKSNSDSE